MRHPLCTLAAALALLVACRRPDAAGSPPAGTGPKETARRVTVLYTAEIHGVLEPCGCTSDPLGDVARLGTVVAAARRDQGPVILVDAGNLSYPEGGLPARERAADELRAGFLARELAHLGLRGAGLGETDLAAGPAQVEPRRLAANLPAAPARSPLAAALLAPSTLSTVNGVKIGVLGVADPALGPPLKVNAADPVEAGKREAARLRQAGAEVVIALAPVEKAVARRLGREADVDFVILGRQVGHGLARAEPAGRAFLLAPADELQRVGRLDVVLRGGPGPLTDAGGPEANELRAAELDAQLRRLDGQLALWESASGRAGADPAFVAAKRRERQDLAAERARLSAPWAPPPKGSYFTNRLIPLSRSLPRDPATAAAMRQLDARVGAVNLRAAPPPAPPEPGRPFFVGIDKCAGCHKAAAAYWHKTVHAHAWDTLVEGGKSADFKCVGCHVTGYGEVGGSSLGHTARLEDVQCETCHGPGSTHVAARGLEEPPAVRREVPATTCTVCHNEQHSDTFNYQAYLRDVLGPGHGAEARKRLGEGPTGHELRAAAVARAKAQGAAALKKLQ